MANEYKKALEDVKSLNKLFGAVKQMAEAFENVSDMENQIISSQKKKKNILDETEALKKNTESLKKEIDGLKSNKLSIEGSIKGLSVSFEEEKSKIMSDALYEKEKVLKEIGVLKEQIGSLNEESKNIDSSISEKKKELTDFENKIEKTKEKLRILVS